MPTGDQDYHTVTKSKIMVCPECASLRAELTGCRQEVERVNEINKGLVNELEECKKELKLTQDVLDDVQGRLDDADEFGSDCAALILSHTGEVPMEADDFVSITDLEQLLIAHKAKEEDERDAAAARKAQP